MYLFGICLLLLARFSDCNESFSYESDNGSVESVTIPREISIELENNLTSYLFTFNDNPGTTTTRIGNTPLQVDCFGLGKTIAVALAWFFASKPNGTNALDVRFSLSSRRQPSRVHVLLGDQFGLEWTDFRIERRTIVIVHGFLSHGDEDWINELENAFHTWGDVNVLVVDWSSGGNTWNYYKAVVNTRIVGYQIARLLERIANTTLTNEHKKCGPLHLVGHSLGAHICGFAAKELKKRGSKWNVERITGLDPAQPCFQTPSPFVKLHKSDAPFVDIIHTNGRLLSHIGLGMPQPMGHVDFYPNGGRLQPGCTMPSTSYFRFLPIPQRMIRQAICSHGRSYIYLTESLLDAAAGNNCTFWAHYWDLTYRNMLQVTGEPCSEGVCSEMGINAEKYSHRGTFLVATADTHPFCINSTRIMDEVKDQLLRDHLSDQDD